MADKTITPAKSAQLIWEEWKYRHEVFWRSFYRWGIASVAVSIFPWTTPDLIRDLRKFVLVFPVLAFILSVFAAWHLFSEYQRLNVIDICYRGLTPYLRPRRIRLSCRFLNWAVNLRIGNVVPCLFLIMAIPISFLNGLLLWLRIDP